MSPDIRNNLKIPCEIYSRVVGYFRPIRQWDKGKREEFQDRKIFKVENDKLRENGN